MGLLEETIKEVRRDIKHFRAGKLPHEDAVALNAMHNTVLKASGQLLTAYGMAVKHHSKYEKRIIGTGLIGNGTVIDLSTEEIEDEKIMCPIKNSNIYRHECLDYSGSHMEDCGDCETGLENKKLLVGPPLHTA